MQRVSMANLVNIDTYRSLTSFARDLLCNGFVESADATYQEARLGDNVIARGRLTVQLDLSGMSGSESAG